MKLKTKLNFPRLALMTTLLNPFVIPIIITFTNTNLYPLVSLSLYLVPIHVIYTSEC